MSHPIDRCPHCGAALAARDISGYPYFRCGSVGVQRTDQCKVHGEAWSELKSLWSFVGKLIEVGDEIVENGSVSERLKTSWEEKNEEFRNPLKRVPSNNLPEVKP